MSRPPARFTEHDLRRAVKVAREAGDDMAVEVLPDGTIRIRKAPQHPEVESAVPFDDGKRWVF